MIFAPIRNGIIAPVIVARGAATSTAFGWRSDKKSKVSLQSEQLQQIENALLTWKQLLVLATWICRRESKT
jgi:hypothetical protein